MGKLQQFWWQLCEISHVRLLLHEMYSWKFPFSLS